MVIFTAVLLLSIACLAGVFTYGLRSAECWRDNQPGNQPNNQADKSKGVI